MKPLSGPMHCCEQRGCWDRVLSILRAVDIEVWLRRARDVNPLIVGLTKNQGTDVPRSPQFSIAVSAFKHGMASSASFLLSGRHRQSCSKSFQSWAHVVLIQMNIDQAEAIMIGKGCLECFFNIAFREHFEAPA